MVLRYNAYKSRTGFERPAEYALSFQICNNPCRHLKRAYSIGREKAVLIAGQQSRTEDYSGVFCFITAVMRN